MVRFVFASFAIVASLCGRAAVGSDVLLLDFTSPNCGPCQQMAPTIENFKRAGYPIQQIDVTRDTQSAYQFKVARVPMLVMLVDGKETERIQGGLSASELEQMFQRAKLEVQNRNKLRARAQSPERRTPEPTSQVAPAAFATENTLRQSERGAPADSSYGRRTPPAASAIVGRAPLDAPPVDPKLAALIGASVRLRVDDAKGHAYGTGTIIDTRQGEALVVTCAHLFRESKGQGGLTVELFEAQAGAVRSVGQVPGLVISYDLDRDVALVAIRPGRSVSVARVAPPRTPIERGDRVVSVGCSNGQDPTILPSRITSLDRYQGPPNIETSGAPVEGRSGGGLFNEQGQLIGVCFAADHEGNEGLYAALKAIHDELTVRGLSDVFNPGNNALAAATTPVASASLGPVVRGQEPGGIALMPAIDRTPSPPGLLDRADSSPATAASVSAPALSNPVEQAAWDEILQRAATSEVICIIRPKQPNGQSEVITLNEVSPEFVRALASLRKDRISQSR